MDVGSPSWRPPHAPSPCRQACERHGASRRFFENSATRGQAQQHRGGHVELRLPAARQQRVRGRRRSTAHRSGIIGCVVIALWCPATSRRSARTRCFASTCGAGPRRTKSRPGKLRCFWVTGVPHGTAEAPHWCFVNTKNRGSHGRQTVGNHAAIRDSPTLWRAWRQPLIDLLTRH